MFAAEFSSSSRYSGTFEPSSNIFPRNPPQKEELPPIDYFSTQAKYQLALRELKEKIPSTSPTHPALKKAAEVLNSYKESDAREIYKKMTHLLRETASAFNEGKLEESDKSFFNALLTMRFTSEKPNELYNTWKSGTPPCKGKVACIFQSLKGMFNQQTFLDSMNIPHLRDTIENRGNTIYRYACPTPMMGISVLQLIGKVLSYIVSFGFKIYEPDRVDPIFVAYLKTLKDRNEVVIYNTLQTTRSPFLGFKRDEAARVRALQKVVEETGHIFMATGVAPKKDASYLSYDFKGKKSFAELKKHLMDVIDANDLKSGFCLKKEHLDRIKPEEIIDELYREGYNDQKTFTTLQWHGFIQNFIAKLRIKLIDQQMNREETGKKIHVFASCMDDIDRGGVQYALEIAHQHTKKNVLMHHVVGRAYLVKSRDMTSKWRKRLNEALPHVFVKGQE